MDIYTRAPEAKQILRSRYNDASGTDVKQTLPQEVYTMESGQMYNFKTPNQELGINNSIFLDNRLNDELRLIDADTIPTINIPNTLGFRSIITNNVPAQSRINTALKPVIEESYLPQHGDFAILPGSNVNEMDPLTRRDTFGIFIPSAVQPNAFKLFEDGPLPATINNVLGLKPLGAQWRSDNLKPSYQPKPNMYSTEQLRQSVLYGPQIY